jgi:chemotaxis protein MotB
MARRLKAEDPDNHERWLVSYADFITLLFAFFVVMYAISSVNNGKYRQLSGSLGSAFHGNPLKLAIADSAPSQVTLTTIAQRRAADIVTQKRRAMARLADTLMRALSPLIASGKVRVTQNALGVTVEINASVLFLPGEAKLSAESGLVLTALADVMRDDTHRLQVEGHTDNTQISNSAFASNWELSAVRAGSVVRLLESRGIAERRLTVIGHGSTQPIVPNDTAEKRNRNRRVTVLILSDEDLSTGQARRPPRTPD